MVKSCVTEVITHTHTKAGPLHHAYSSSTRKTDILLPGWDRGYRTKNQSAPRNILRQLWTSLID